MKTTSFDWLRRKKYFIFTYIFFLLDIIFLYLNIIWTFI